MGRRKPEPTPAPEKDTTPKIKVAEYVSLELEPGKGYPTTSGYYAVYHQTATVSDLESFLTAVDRQFKGEDVSVKIKDGVLTAHRTITND